MMKKETTLLRLLCLLMFVSGLAFLFNKGHETPNVVLAGANDSATTIFEQSPVYRQYASSIDQHEKPVVKNVYDDNGNLSEIVLRYSFATESVQRFSKNQANGTATTTVSSPLLVLIDPHTNSVKSALLLDLSSLASESGSVEMNNLMTGEKQVAKADDFFGKERTADLRAKIQTDVKDTVDDATANKPNKLITDSKISSYSIKAVVSCQIWTCTKTQSGGGHNDTNCLAIAKDVCAVALKKWPIWPVAATCVGTQLVGCYVPKYKVCVAGYWTGYNVCPSYN